MVFVDGENLAIRYGAMLKGRDVTEAAKFCYRPDVAVWTQQLSPAGGQLAGTRVVRKYFYTSVRGDADKIDETTDWLKSRGFESPRVFKKNKDRGSKQVDISLATDMLTHASKKHYDIAVLGPVNTIEAPRRRARSIGRP